MVARGLVEEGHAVDTAVTAGAADHIVYASASPALITGCADL